MARVKDLYIDQGSDFSISFEVLDEAGEPIDLTGKTLRSQVRKWFGSTMGYDFEATVIDSENSIIELVMINPTMAAGRWRYDVIALGESVSDITRIVEGSVIVSPSITESE